MRHSGIIVRIGLEADGKDIVLVVPRHVDVTGPRLVVLQLGDTLGPLYCEAVEFIAGPRELFQIGEGGIGPFWDLAREPSAFPDREPGEG